ncbi:MAG: hypothetical protein R2807_07480 [Chitinophagales bacterium]
MVRDLKMVNFISKNLDNPYYNTVQTMPMHFNFDFGGKLDVGNFYVLGAFNNWTCNDDSKMYYDVLDKSYALNLLLKQGMYNYTMSIKMNKPTQRIPI